MELINLIEDTDIFLRDLIGLSAKDSAISISLPSKMQDNSAISKKWQKNNRKEIVDAIYAFFCRRMAVKVAIDKNVLKENPKDCKDDIARYNMLLKHLTDVFPFLNDFLANIPIQLPRKHDEQLIAILEKYNLSQLNSDLTGRLYQSYISIGKRKAAGQYLTPDSIIDYTLDRVDYIANKRILGKRIIDPACGAGGFLIRAAGRLIKAGRISKMPPWEIVQQTINSIYGIEIDPFLAHLARLNLFFVLCDLLGDCLEQIQSYKFPKFNIFNADALAIPKKTKPLMESHPYGDLAFFSSEDQSIVDQIKFRRLDFAKGFDFIVTNPPYYKVRNMSTAQYEFFRESIFGHPNAYGLFLHLGIQIARKGGRLGFVIPESIKSGLYFKRLRKLILNRTELVDVLLFKSRVSAFQGVLQAIMVLSLKRKGQAETNMILINETENIKTLEANKLSTAEISPEEAIRSINREPVFVFSSCAAAYGIFEKVFGNSESLQQLGYQVKTGQVVWNRLRKYLRDYPGEGHFPLVWSDNFQRYYFNHPGAEAGRSRWIALSKKTHFLRNRGQAILVKRTTAKEQKRRIIASIPREWKWLNYGYFLENHTNLITQIGPVWLDENYVLAFLNSKLCDFIFRMASGNTQVSATELNGLPIPSRVSTKEKAALERIVQRTEELKRNKNPRDAQEIEAKIDQIFYRICRLNREEIATIEQSYGNHEED
ncbi:MAG: class I SAM-dependent DNA methyltransferase [Candidatus Hodarchaeota archaeon]